MSLTVDQNELRGGVRVLHVLPTLKPGGAQNVALGLVRHLGKNGINATTLCLGARTEATVHERSDTETVHYLGCPFPANLRDVYKFTLAQVSLSQFLRQLRPQIIHSHLFLSKLPIACNATARKSVIVDTVHDNLPWWRQNSLKARLMRRFDRFYASEVAQHSIAISDSVRDDLLQFGICPESCCSTIYNFIDARWSEAGELVVDRDRKRIAICSRISIDKKGLDLAVAIVSRLVGMHPDLEVVVLGDGEDMPRFREMISLAGLERYFKLLGHVEDPLPFYKRASLLLMPSRWEGFGLTAAEAGAAGCPVIASRVGGLSEVIEDDKTGILCDVGSIDQFVAAAHAVLRDASLGRRLGESAAQKVSGQFHVKSAMQDHIELYARVLRRSGST